LIELDALTGSNRALSPTRRHYHSQVYVVEFLNNQIYFCKERRALAFNWDRCCH